MARGVRGALFGWPYRPPSHPLDGKPPPPPAPPPPATQRETTPPTPPPPPLPPGAGRLR